MYKVDLKPCPFCGRIPIFHEYHETCDGRGDRHAHIECKCGIEMRLTSEEFYKAQDNFGYTGGYYSQNEEFWGGMHQKLIDKWNEQVADCEKNNNMKLVKVRIFKDNEVYVNKDLSSEEADDVAMSLTLEKFNVMGIDTSEFEIAVLDEVFT